MEAAEIISKNFDSIIRHVGLTNEEVEFRTGLNKYAIGKMRNGKQRITGEFIYTFCQTFSVDSNAFFNFDKWFSSGVHEKDAATKSTEFLSSAEVYIKVDTNNKEMVSYLQRILAH